MKLQEHFKVGRTAVKYALVHDVCRALGVCSATPVRRAILKVLMRHADIMRATPTPGIWLGNVMTLMPAPCNAVLANSLFPIFRI